MTSLTYLFEPKQPHSWRGSVAREPIELLGEEAGEERRLRGAEALAETADDVPGPPWWKTDDDVDNKAEKTINADKTRQDKITVTRRQVKCAPLHQWPRANQGMRQFGVAAGEGMRARKRKNGRLKRLPGSVGGRRKNQRGDARR